MQRTPFPSEAGDQADLRRELFNRPLSFPSLRHVAGLAREADQLGDVLSPSAPRGFAAVPHGLRAGEEHLPIELQVDLIGGLRRRLGDAVALGAQPRHAALLAQLDELTAHRIAAKTDVEQQVRKRLDAAVGIMLPAVTEQDLRCRVAGSNHIGDADFESIRIRNPFCEVFLAIRARKREEVPLLHERNHTSARGIEAQRIFRRIVRDYTD
jgi:hypothetical protein